MNSCVQVLGKMSTFICLNRVVLTVLCHCNYFAFRSFVKHISADTESDVVKVTATTVAII